VKRTNRRPQVTIRFSFSIHFLVVCSRAQRSANQDATESSAHVSKSRIRNRPLPRPFACQLSMRRSRTQCVRQNETIVSIDGQSREAYHARTTTITTRAARTTSQDSAPCDQDHNRHPRQRSPACRRTHARASGRARVLRDTGDVADADDSVIRSSREGCHLRAVFVRQPARSLHCRPAARLPRTCSAPRLDRD
jgi:hypothetical protein